jgi:hypothetical protein
MGGVVDMITGGPKTDISSNLTDPRLGNQTGLNMDFGGQIRDRNQFSLDMAPQDEFRSQQMDFAKQLAAQSRGEGPSLAQQQLKQATDQNLASQMAAAASQRGVQGGLGQRLVAQQAANTQQQAAQGSALARTNEQLQAQGLLGNALQGGRQQDLGAQGLNLQNQQAKDAFTQSLIGLGNQRDLGLLNAQVQGGQAAGQLEEAQNARRGKGFGNFLSGLGGGIMQAADGGGVKGFFGGALGK